MPDLSAFRRKMPVVTPSLSGSIVSDLAVTEIVSSLCRRRREGAVSTQVVDMALGWVVARDDAARAG